MKRALLFFLAASAFGQVVPDALNYRAPIRFQIQGRLLAWNTPAAGGGAITLITHVGAQSSNGGNSVTTGSVDTSGANLLVCATIAGTSTPNTPTDAKGNTWTGLTAYHPTGGSVFVKMWYSVPTTVGSGETFSFSQSSTFPSIFCGAWSNSIASPFDVENGNGTTSSPVQPGSITPSANNYLVVTSAYSNAATGAPTVSGGSVTLLDSAALSGGNAYGGGLGYVVQTTATAVNPTWASTGSPSEMASGIASFK